MIEVRLSRHFPIDSLAEGRVDLICRFISSSFFVSHAVRRNVSVLASLGKGPAAPKTIAVAGAEVTYLKPNERHIAVLLKKSLVCSPP